MTFHSLRVLLRWSLPTIGLALLVAPTLAQPRGSTERANFPAVGSQLPDVTVYDEDGQAFATSKLRGHHCVLVFGCLT